MFQALLLEKSDTFSARVQSVDESALPQGDVLVRVDWSTLNYKDGLAITNKGPVVRQWPMVAGIDGAGVVFESSHPQWKAGDAFIHNGWGVGKTLRLDPARWRHRGPRWHLAGRATDQSRQLPGGGAAQEPPRGDERRAPGPERHHDAL